MKTQNTTYIDSCNKFISSYNTVENTYLRNKGSAGILDNQDFSTAFFNCFDFLSELTPEEIKYLKGDLDLHCKIVMFDTIKLDIIARNPSLLSIKNMHRIF